MSVFDMRLSRLHRCRLWLRRMILPVGAQKALRCPVRRASRRQLAGGGNLRGERGWTRCHVGGHAGRHAGGCQPPPERVVEIRTGQSRPLNPQQNPHRSRSTARYVPHPSQRQAHTGVEHCDEAAGRRPMQPARKASTRHKCLVGWTYVSLWDIKITTSDRAGKSSTGRNRLFFRGRNLFRAFLVTEENLLAKPSGCSIDYDFNDRKKRIEWTFRSKTSTEECL